MKTPEWRQNVLLVSDDPEIVTVVAPAFGKETHLITANSATEAIVKLEQAPINVLIIDAKTTNPKRHYFEDNEATPFVELSQYAGQLNLGVTIILLVNKLLCKDGNFARKCGAVLIMDRKNILINRMVHLIGVLRKRTFRTLLVRDIPQDAVLPVDVYHYLPLNGRYSVFLPSGSPFSAEKKEKIQSLEIRHLYVMEAEFSMALSACRSDGPILFSESLASIRNQFRQLLVQVFDISTDGMVHFGKELYARGLDIAAQLENLIDQFPDAHTCLEELPYPRRSTLAHCINCGIYAVLFSRVCKLGPSQEIVFAAMIHNIGHSDIDQALLQKNEMDLTPEQVEQYQKHIDISLELLRNKLLPFSPMVEAIILNHHENFDGTGFPSGLSGTNLPLESALVSIIGSFNYFNTVRTGQRPVSTTDAWDSLRVHNVAGSLLEQKFHPLLMAQLDSFFHRKLPAIK